MPWCDRCDAYRAPNVLDADGTCATCHEPVDTADLKVRTLERAPWHFWLMALALVGYLGWRLIQGVVWLAVNSTATGHYDYKKPADMAAWMTGQVLSMDGGATAS